MPQKARSPAARRVLTPRAAIRRVGIVSNTDKPAASRLARSAAARVARLGLTAIWGPGTSPALSGGKPTAASVRALAQETDLLLVFGGDGTLLRAAREAAGIHAPILGINAGRLGFLTDVPAERLGDALRRVVAGRYTVEERAMLEGGVVKTGAGETLTALNDLVIDRGPTPRLIELKVQVNGQLMARCRCDGFIASTPTGSTAYSLAAGGAVLAPDAEALILTPISPHSLGLRPVVISLRAEVLVTLLTPGARASLTADGQQQIEVHPGDTVRLRRSRRTVRLLRLEGASFFSTLRQKLGWGGAPV